jgi:uncharacterized protein (TIGR03435 family)
MVKALLILALLAAQTGSPEFEAASVKPSPPGAPYGGMRGGPGTSSPGQINYVATTVHAVMARAYGVQRFQVVGPPWLDEGRFDFTAKVPPNTTPQQLQFMLQKLLADRFKLAFHRENRTAVVYDMTIAKGGPKMTAMPATGAPAAQRESTPPPVSGLFLNSDGDKIELVGQRATMRQLVIWVTDRTDRPIVDKTGLTDTYNFVMPWLPAWIQQTERSADQELGVGSDGLTVGDTIYTALEKYLGLRLVARREPVEMLIIDHLERVPAEN